MSAHPCNVAGICRKVDTNHRAGWTSFRVKLVIQVNEAGNTECNVDINLQATIMRTHGVTRSPSSPKVDCHKLRSSARSMPSACLARQ